MSGNNGKIHMKELNSDIKNNIINWIIKQEEKQGGIYFRTADVAASMRLTLNHARDILNELYDENIIDYIPPGPGVPPLWFLK